MKKSRWDERFDEIYNQVNACAGDWTVVHELVEKFNHREPAATIQHCLMEVELEDPQEKFVAYIEFWREESQIDMVQEYTEAIRKDLHEMTGDFYPKV